MTRSIPTLPRATSERRDYRLIVAVTFPAFLVAAAVQRAIGVGAPDPHGRRSLFAEARALADSTIPFAFMG